MNSIFTEEQEILSEESWRLLLKQKSDKEIYMERQREILRGIFE